VNIVRIYLLALSFQEASPYFQCHLYYTYILVAQRIAARMLFARHKHILFHFVMAVSFVYFRSGFDASETSSWRHAQLSQRHDTLQPWLYHLIKLTSSFHQKLKWFCLKTNLDFKVQTVFKKSHYVPRHRITIADITSAFTVMFCIVSYNIREFSEGWDVREIHGLNFKQTREFLFFVVRLHMIKFISIGSWWLWLSREDTHASTEQALYVNIVPGIKKLWRKKSEKWARGHGICSSVIVRGWLADRVVYRNSCLECHAED
jgi:hypothetical protein